VSKSEYGKRCQSCWKYVECRIFYNPVRGRSGRDRDVVKFRRICRECWDLAVDAARGLGETT